MAKQYIEEAIARTKGCGAMDLLVALAILEGTIDGEVLDRSYDHDVPDAVLDTLYISELEKLVALSERLKRRVEKKIGVKEAKISASMVGC